ncbi:MAG: OB-fold nucleic acid binding domain-containing protein [Methylovirgula sp.]
MDMRDAFGIAVAIVIALVTQIVQPWSKPWWVGMIVATSIAIVIAGNLLLPSVVATQKSIAMIGMAGSGFVFLICAGWYFWPLSGRPLPKSIERPALAPTTSAPIQQKEFTTKTVRQLLALYEGLTPFQADKLIAPFKGLWIKAESQILTILPDGSDRSVVVLRDHKDTIECRFGPEWSNTIARLSIGDTLHVLGKISPNQNGSQLYLLECEPL